jgi:hypothetical protein
MVFRGYLGIPVRYIQERILTNMGRLSVRLGVLFLCAFSLTACAAKQRVTSINNVFLEDVDISSTRPNLPFEHAWVSPNYSKSEFKGVYIKPIRIDLLPPNEWNKSASAFVRSEEEFREKARDIAEYFRGELVEKTRSSSKQRLRVVNSPSPDSLVIEIAITELELAHPVARAGSLVAPVPGTGAAIAAISDPHVAFAARITDGASGRLLATAADRKFAPLRIIDLNKLTVSSSAREVCALWSDTMAAALQGDGFTKIEEKNFDWKLW